MSYRESEKNKIEIRMLRYERRRTKEVLGGIAVFAILLIVLGVVLGGAYLLSLRSTDELYARVAQEVVSVPSVEVPASDASRTGDEENRTGDDENQTGNEEENRADDPGKNVDSEGDAEAKAAPKEYSFKYTGDWKEQISVDLAALQEQYPDVKGWLFFENDDISYPILYSGDDSTYLRTTFEGKSAVAGSIFMEGENAPDFSDQNTIIYGHNMRNRSMFGRLKDYVNEPNYYEYHQYFQIITTDEEGNLVKYRYKVFSYFNTKKDTDVYAVYEQNCPAFEEYVRCVREQSLRAIPDEVSGENKIVTLSTCSIGENRFTVHAYLVDIG